MTTNEAERRVADADRRIEAARRDLARVKAEAKPDADRVAELRRQFVQGDMREPREFIAVITPALRRMFDGNHRIGVAMDVLTRAQEDRRAAEEDRRDARLADVELYALSTLGLAAEHR